MAVGNKFYSFVEARGRKVHNLHTDVLKVFLTNAVPVAANSVKADIAEIAAGNGYPAGGPQIPNTSYTQVAGVATLAGDDVIIVAAGGPIGPFQAAVLYNDTALNDELIGWWPYGASQSLAAGESLTIDIDQVNGILTDQ